jgi:hypothetical protein
VEPRTKKIISIIVFIILGIFLVLGLFMTRCIGCEQNTDNIKTIDDQLKGEINNLFSNENTKLIIGFGADRTIIIRQGTENFGIPIGFSPNNSQAWGANKGGCKYNITPLDKKSLCIGKDWTNPSQDIITGTNNVLFDQVDNNIGYTIIKINVPEDISPCLQRFIINVSCAGYPKETTASYFDLEVIKKGLF